MDHLPPRASSPTSHRGVLTALITVVALYGLSLLPGWPQQATARILGDPSHHGTSDTTPSDQDEPVTTADLTPPPLVMVLPFVFLLAAIALFPLFQKTSHWWESNLHKLAVAGLLAAITLAYFGLFHRHPVQQHFLGHAIALPAQEGVSWGLAWTVFQNAIFNDFIPFIVLLFSLYTVTGGIRVEGDLQARPAVNTAFLAIGAVLASVIGTTGASMLLIRPLLETNSERRHVRHTIVFFIFTVSNCGGLLLPLGDPPLFLGYLQGVDFLWTLSLWPQWLFVNSTLLVVYYLWDRCLAYPHESKAELAADIRQIRPLRIAGVWPNALILVGIVLCVALLDVSKPFPGAQWHPWLYLREVVLLALVAVSLGLGDRHVRVANRFDYGAILEVAALFVGIFLCMQPALQYLNTKGDELPLTAPWHFFWATGVLSSILDNAPTYLVFFEAAQASKLSGATSLAHVGIPDAFLAAVSLGAVFMGANTYIGNGPNFMVKTIAEKSGVRMPSFFGYMLYSLGILIPIFAVVGWWLG